MTLALSLASFQPHINEIKVEPAVITAKPVFNKNAVTKIGRWAEGAEVSYAVQYRTKQAVSRCQFDKHFT